MDQLLVDESSIIKLDVHKNGRVFRMNEVEVAKILSDPRSKVNRATRHYNSLVRETNVMPREIYKIRNGPAFSNVALSRPDLFELTFEPTEPIPVYYKAIIGDALNNLRESLDFLMTRIVRIGGSKSKVYFPVMENRDTLSKHQSWKIIESVAPNTAEFVKTVIGPCKDENIDLWKLHQLWNLNKHNDFVPSAANAKAICTDITTGNAHIGVISYSFDANQKGIIVRSKSPITVDRNIKVSCELTFSNNSHYSGEPVIQTLINLINVVSETIDKFENFLKQTNAP